MKKLRNLFSILIAVFMLLNFTACGNSDGDSLGNSDDGSEIVMTYEGLSLSEKEYMFILSNTKTSMISYYQSYLYSTTGSVYDEASILAMPLGEDGDRTVADFINDYAMEIAQQLLIIEKLCLDAGIEVTNEEDLADISGYIADVEYAYGGTDLFEIALAKLGFTRAGIERYEKLSLLYELYFEHRYGENGVAPIPSSTVNKYFVENYIAYDGCMYSYINGTDGSDIVFEFTDDEIHDYFYEKYVKVRHVLFKTVDDYGSALSEELIADKKKAAEDALAAIQGGEKTIYDYENSNEDYGNEYTFTYDTMVEEFETASFEMEVGEVRLVETAYGFHLVQKLALTDEDLYGTEAEVASEESAVSDSDDSSSVAEESDGSQAESDSDEEETAEVKENIEEDVIAAMSRDKIRDEAHKTLEKLQSGELESYPEEDSDIEYYVLMSAGFVDKNSTDDATFVEILSGIDKDVYSESELIADSATYILRNVSFTEEDITSTIYSTIEEELAFDSYNELLQSNYDKVEINYDVLDRFDVNTVPVLADEFYTE